MPLLEVESTTVRFGQVAALSDVSLTVGPGSVVGVLGPNGAGKTTLLRSIMARVPRASGRLVFDGRDITSLKTAGIVKTGIALCPENRRLFPHMSIEDNLRLGAYGSSRKVIAERLEQAYEQFAWIGKRRGELAGRLSGGEQQAVAIARSLMAKPKLLLLDEPSSGLSPVAVDEIGAVLATVPDTGTAVMLVEQNVKLVESLCQQAWVLSRGTVHSHGPVGELLAGVSVADAYLGGSDIDEQVHDGSQPSGPDERKS